MFTGAEAIATGWTPDALERAVRSGRMLRLRPGVYCVVPDESELHPADRARRHRARQAVAAALVTTDAVVTALGAATLLGWPTWAPRERACLSVPGATSTSVDGVHLHRGRLPASAVASVAGFRLTRPSRTIVDVACEFGTEAGLVVADAAMAASLTTPERLRWEIERCDGQRGIASARPLPALMDPEAESVLESRSRWQLAAADLPRARPQTWLYDLDGRFLGRTDFYWAAGVVGEVDGAGKLTEPGARQAFLQRQLLLTRAGLRVVRWREADLHAFGPTEAWIREELAAAAADPRPPRWRVGTRLGVGSAVSMV